MPDSTTAPVTAEGVPSELIEILDRTAGKEHSRTGSVVACLAEILTAYRRMLMPVPVTAEGLRERLEQAELASEVVRAPDGNVSVITHSNRTAADRATTVLAQLIDPGDLPDRMAAEMERHNVDESQPPPATLDADYCTCGELIKNWRQHIAAAVMSVRWEGHAATVAQLAQALARAEHAEKEHQVTRERLAEARRERKREIDRGIAVDAELERQRKRAERAEAERGELKAAKHAAFDEAMLKWLRAEGVIQEVRALVDKMRHGENPFGGSAADSADILDRALAVPESPGDAETEDRP